MVKKEQIKKFEYWHQLTEFIENMNPYKYTLVLCGFIQEYQSDKLFIKDLYFKVVPVEILVEKKDDLESKSKRISDSKEGNEDIPK